MRAPGISFQSAPFQLLHPTLHCAVNCMAQDRIGSHADAIKDAIPNPEGQRGAYCSIDGTP